MKKIKLGSVILHLSIEDGDVRAISDFQNIILPNQNVENIAELIVYNFKMVDQHYKDMIKGFEEAFSPKDIDVISVKIVMFYLYMYNSWRNSYRKQENIDLRFKNKDFNDASTFDIIFNFYKTKYPNQWLDKCSVILGMEMDRLIEYYENRTKFYNK